MRTETIEIFKFEELNPEQQQQAIEKFREKLYQNNDFAEWSIDNCYLLNPPHKEVVKLTTELADDILIKNNRTIYFDLERGRHLDISKAMEVQDNDLFLKWLGVTDRMIKEDNVHFTIGKDTIDFEENDYNIDFSDRDLRILERAKEKFEDHCSQILKDIEADIDYRFTDEAIKEDIECNDYEFTEDGEQY